MRLKAYFLLFPVEPINKKRTKISTQSFLATSPGLFPVCHIMFPFIHKNIHIHHQREVDIAIPGGCEIALFCETAQN